ncbi:hypothetical protein BEL04_08275 [Mucilaginibacter sp. PPCGB 2223]|nr:hypothetical protein BEL04_08275 [Mucilaginibacter sp. PPCGB 2223]
MIGAVPPTVNEVGLSNWLPLMVTTVPTGALPGLKELMTGSCCANAGTAVNSTRRTCNFF